MTPTQAQSAAPGVYYAVYNLGGNPVCYSQPTALKVATNVCPATTVELKASVDSTGKPSGSIVTFHSDPVATDANRITNTLITTTSTAVVYFVAYRDASGCYTTSNSAIVAIATTCSVLCLAGSSSPVLSSSTKSNVCPATLVDLNAITASNLPANTTLTWHSFRVATTANKLNSVSVSGVGAGKYYAAFFDATNNCYSPADSVTVTINVCNCPAGTTAPIIAATSLQNSCPAVTVSLASLTNTGTKPSGTTLVWSTHKVPASSADTLTSLTVSASGKFYAMYYHKVANCFSPADSVAVQINDCESPIPPLPPVPTACDYNTAPANVTLTVSNEPAGYLKTYLLVDMANGQIVKINPTNPSFTGVNAGNYYVVGAYYADTLRDASVGKRITEVYSTSGCLKYSTPLAFRVCGACDYTTAPVTITFNATPSATAGVTTSYVLIDEKTNTIKAISSTASFAAVDTGYYAVVAVYRTKPINFVVGNVLYSKVTVLDSCYEVSNSGH
ncbi:MAG TPA: hypothetical protein DCM71_09760 [Runella sp.]|nr:hypothetical protein [Runella sp.]